LVAVGDEASQHIDQEIRWTPLATMFNLGDILQLVMDGFDQHSLAQEQLIVESDQAWLHVLADGGEQIQPLLQEARHQGWGEIAFIPNQRGL
jgi:hypothetical protein